MTEMAKTIAFVAVAAGSLLVAFVVGSNVDQFDVESLVGERLNQFEVEAPKRLKIVKFDNDTAAVREFEVAEAEGLWTIPSKQSYPADAARQMAEAATCLIDREVLRVAAKSASQHQELGVIDPTSSNLDSKAEGVGIRITMTDVNENTLTDMIIGKPVKDADGQYHVRNVDQDVVYVVSLNPEPLSTRFEDWIEDDLLKLNPLDIRTVHIKDYSAEMQPVITAEGIQIQVGWHRRGEISLRYDEEQSEWLPELLYEFDAGKKEMVEYTLAEDEELNSEVLTELRNGLDDLLLVDVERKPGGLSADLKAGGNFLNNNEAISSLMERGFAPVASSPGGDTEILSSEGEITYTLQDGVEYVLRFGNLKVNNEVAAEANASLEETQEVADTGIHRYLFVMARFNEEIIPQPELVELPELPESSTEESTSSPAETASVGEDEAEEENPDNSENILAARQMIEQENQRRLDEYQDKIKSANQRVQELNERFGDWYYVISNDVYKKIHLDREKLVTKKTQEEQSSSLP